MRRRLETTDPSMRLHSPPVTGGSSFLPSTIVRSSGFQKSVRVFSRTRNSVIRNRSVKIGASRPDLLCYPISAGHSLRTIPAPSAFVEKFGFAPAGSDSFPKASSGPLPKTFRLGLGAAPSLSGCPGKAGLNERR